MGADDWRGFRRKIRISPSVNQVICQLEDDFHCMAVAIEHDGITVSRLTPEMIRAPWSTCPGAGEVIKSACEGKSLADVAKLGNKAGNCTHLYDLTVLAVNHAFDEGQTEIDIWVDDPTLRGEAKARLYRDKKLVLDWLLNGFEVIEPVQAKGVRLERLGSWLNSLPLAEQELAKLLRWAAMIAHGRAIPLAQQSDAMRMPPNCYTFQPERAISATRVGKICDFSVSNQQPLQVFDAANANKNN